MPWIIADVDSHIKGLSPIQKKRWVEIANGTLKDCMAKGGDDTTCAPKAIKAANAASKDFNLALFLDGPLVNIRGMEIFRTGNWNGRKFKEEDIKRMEKNFHALKDQLIPKLKITHRQNQETLAGLASFGDMVNLVARGSNGSLRLFADFDFVPQKVAEWIRDRRFAERSIELRFGFKVDETLFKDVIVAVSLLGHEIPAVSGMEPIKLSKEDNLLETKELVGIAYSLEGDGEEFTLEECKFTRGDGKGQDGPQQGDGGADICVCPSCNFEKQHDKGVPCTEISCPECGTKMRGKNKDNTKKGGDNMEIKDVLDKIAMLQSTIEGIVLKQKEAGEKFQKEQDTKEKEKLQQELETYKKDLDGLKEMKQDYEKMQVSLEEAKKENEKLHVAAKCSKVESFLKDLKISGKLLPAFEAEAKALLLQLGKEDKLGNFSKTDAKGKTAETELSSFEALQNLLVKLPKIVDFKESSPSGEGELESNKEDIKIGNDTYKLSDVELDNDVQKYMKEHTDVDYATALIAVSAKFSSEGKAQGLSAEE